MQQPFNPIEAARHQINNAVHVFLSGVANSPDTHRGGQMAAAQAGTPQDHDVENLSTPCKLRFMPDGNMTWWFHLSSFNGVLTIDGGQYTWTLSVRDPQNPGSLQPVADSTQPGANLDPATLQAVANEIDYHLQRYGLAWFPQQPAQTTMMAPPQSPQQVPQPVAAYVPPTAKANLRQLFSFTEPWLPMLLAALSLCIGVFGVIPGTAAAVSLGIQWVRFNKSGQPIKSQPWLIVATAVTVIVFFIFCYNTVQTLMEANEYLDNYPSY